MSALGNKRWRPAAAFFVAAFAGGFAATSAACGSKSSPGIGFGSDSGGGGDGSSSTCSQCVTDTDCNGGVCAQVGGDSYCLSACPNGNECGSDTTCMPVSNVEGAQVSACVPANDCGGMMDMSDQDSGAPPSDICGPLYGPNEPAKCSSCGTMTCQPNGCYGGWWCNTTSMRCQSPPNPSSCPGMMMPVPSLDAGPVTGTVGNTGGSVSRLMFAVVGDTRPATEDDTSNYPTSVITGIYQDIQALNPTPSFVVSTGDYQFSNPSGSQASAQMDLYLGARASFKNGPSFPAMGNHECNGATVSNCGSGNTNGVTNNYQSFMTKMMQPLGQSKPYYEIDVDAMDKSWTAKFLVVAANAWDSTQSAWLDGAMAKATTYTFLIRHESASTSPAPPGVAGAEGIMAKHPYTLSFVGHTHSYYHGKGAREVLFGNGGAPLTSKSYGFGLVQQRSDGAIVVDAIDATTKAADGYFHFAVKADGSTTTP
jgi:hypothetical protein